MKRLFLKTMTLSAAMLTAALWAGQAQAAISGSKHDLTSGSGNSIRTTNTSIGACDFCHTPHQGVATGGAPLWNRNLPTSTGYTMYSRSGDTSPSGNPQTRSLLCLSCHDGSVAINALINAPGSGAGSPPAMFNGVTTMPSGSFAYVGRDLTNDHPVSMSVPNVARPTDFRAPTGSILTAYNAAGTSVECTSCHEPHDKSGHGMFLRISNGGSALCLNCHVR